MPARRPLVALALVAARFEREDARGALDELVVAEGCGIAQTDRGAMQQTVGQRAREVIEHGFG